jgi:hypothetical protein
MAHMIYHHTTERLDWLLGSVGVKYLILKTADDCLARHRQNLHSSNIFHVVGVWLDDL